jgi:hypothetical protein
MPSTSTSTDYALIRLAARLPRRDYPTGASVARALAALSEPATRAAVARVRPVLEQLAAARAARRPLGVPGLLRGVARPMFPRGPARLSTLSLAERLQRYRVSRLYRAFVAAGVRVGVRDEIEFRPTPGARAAVDQLVTSCYPYKGRYRGYPAYKAHITITVPADWITRVQKRGLSVVDGLMTLDASPVGGVHPEIPDLETYRVVYLRARRLNLSAGHGYVVRSGELTAHGPDANSAVDTLLVKRRAYSASPRRRAEASLARLIQGYESCRATYADAAAVGACRIGVESWADAVGIDPAGDSISLRQLADGFKIRPAREARLIALHVVRRARAERRAARAPRSAA